MASSYPGGYDAFSNPTSTDNLDSVTVPHAAQHGNANDAIEAIEAELGLNPSGSQATVRARIDGIEAVTGSLQAPNSLLFALYYV